MEIPDLQQPSEDWGVDTAKYCLAAFQISVSIDLLTIDTKDRI